VILTALVISVTKFVIIFNRQPDFDESQCPNILQKLKSGSVNINTLSKIHYIEQEKKVGEDGWISKTLVLLNRPYLNCLGQDDPLLHRTIQEEYLVKGNVSSRRFTKPYESIDHPPQYHDLVHHVFKNVRNGFFIEAGSVDGQFMSISLPFEVEYNWTGLLVEADPSDHQLALLRNRNVYYINTCLGLTERPSYANFEFEPKFISAKGQLAQTMAGLSERNQGTGMKMQCFPVYSLIKAMGNPTVNLLILDIEGAELSVLKTIPWESVDIQVMTIETDLIGKSGVSGGSQKEARQFLISKGYSIFQHTDDFNKHTGLQNNDLFIRNDILPSLGDIKLKKTVP